MKRKNANGNARGRLSDGTPNPIDVYVGSRVRMRRSVLGMSQERLAAELGVTFQQVQKYEHGSNRIGASRLWDFAQVLGVDVDFFYKDIDKNAIENSPRKITNTYTLSDNVQFFDMGILLRKDARALINNYAKITDPKIQKNILDIVCALAETSQKQEENQQEYDNGDENDFEDD